MGLPTDKNEASCREMHFPAEKYRFLGGAHGRKSQEFAGGFQGSRIKNASQLPQEKLHTNLEGH